MTVNGDVAGALSDLIDVMHLQARELEKLTAHLERQTGQMPDRPRLSLVLSELSELQVRMRDIMREEVREETPAPLTP